MWQKQLTLVVSNISAALETLPALSVTRALLLSFTSPKDSTSPRTLLATVGASALTDKVTQAMGKSVGKNALELGSKIISEVAKGKTEKLLNHIKGGGGGGFTGLPDDISEKLTVENKKSLASFVGRKKKRKSSTKKIKTKTKRKVGGKKISKTKKRKKVGRKPKKAGRKKAGRKKAGRKPKKAGRKKGGLKARVTKTKRKTATSIFD